MKIKNIAYGVVALAALASCDTEYEPITIQKPFVYDEQYYANIRAFKASDHEMSYAYFEGYAALEGIKGESNSSSFGNRIAGLPDSIDIVNMWMGAPDPITMPTAWADMHFAQEKLGTRFVYHADAAHLNHWLEIDKTDNALISFLEEHKITRYNGNEEEDANGDSILLRDLRNYTDVAIDLYAKKIVKAVLDGDLNGVDLDYEPNDSWWVPNHLPLVKKLGEFFGPKGADPTKLLMVDYFGHTPAPECDEYCDYFIQQAYSDQTSPRLNPSFTIPEKHFIIEQFGNGSMGQDETKNRLLEYAAMEPGNGHHKAGCGVYYLGRNYYDNSGIPYNCYRKAIQIMNPSVEK